MDKFLLADNPMRSGPSGLYIIHMIDPIAIIQIDPGHLSMNGIYKHYSLPPEFSADEHVGEWEVDRTLSIYHFFTTDFLEQPEDRAPKLLDRAWRWYRAYMEWEDKQHG